MKESKYNSNKRSEKWVESVPVCGASGAGAADEGVSGSLY